MRMNRRNYQAGRGLAAITATRPSSRGFSSPRPAASSSTATTTAQSLSTPLTLRSIPFGKEEGDPMPWRAICHVVWPPLAPSHARRAVAAAPR
jgi:hypothetical protein